MNGRSLGGAGVLVTRPAQLAGELIEAVTAAGGEPFAFPVIDIVARPTDAVAAELAGLAPADVIVFVSRNAVAYGLEALRGSAARIAAVGPATARALEAAGHAVDVVPASGFDSEHLLAHPALEDVAGKRVRIVRGDGGRELLAETLTQRGATVDYVAVYRRTRHRFDAEELDDVSKRIVDGRLRFVTAMSVGTLDHLLGALPRNALDKLPGARLVTPSARVIQTAVKRIPGIRSLLATGPGATQMVAAMIADNADD